MSSVALHEEGLSLTVLFGEQREDFGLSSQARCTWTLSGRSRDVRRTALHSQDLPHQTSYTYKLIYNDLNPEPNSTLNSNTKHLNGEQF